ncbi:MAG: hypothetical protein U0746_05830 [Gemmataceae bacterium]
MRRAVLVVSLLVAGRGTAGELTPECLIRMSRCQLLDLYHAGTAAAPPVGFVRGYPIFEPGRRLTVMRTHATRLLWQGKEFNCQGDTMVNHVVGAKMVHAAVFPGESWFDGAPTLVFDYQCTSKLFSGVRDEVREVAPGVFLGLTYLRKSGGPELAVFFVLDARPR